MKKTMLLFVILAIMLSGSLFAEGLGFGAKAGMNMAKFSGDDAELFWEGIIDSDPGFIFGPTLGGFVTYQLTDALSARAELLFAQKGSKYKIDYSESESGVTFSIDGDVKVKMNWLEIPMLGVYSLTDAISIFAGPYIELYLSGKAKTDITAKYSYEGVSNSESEEDTEDIEGEDVNSLGFGLLFGGTYLLTENIGLEPRLSIGLTSIDEDYTVKNFGIQLFVNYYLKK